ncbi:MAG: PAS domain S-box protein [Bacteroidota bacterium]
MVGLHFLRIAWEKIAHTGVRPHLMATDVFRIRFFNGAIAVIAALSLFNAIIFYALGLLEVSCTFVALFFVLTFSLYLQKIHLYRVALRSFLLGCILFIMTFSLLFGGVLAVSSFWIVLATIVYFIKRDSTANYYLTTIFLCFTATYYCHNFAPFHGEIEHLHLVEMIFIPTTLFIQIVLINLFNNELYRQERRNLQQQSELNRAISLTQATLESTSDGLLVVNLEGKISNYNQKFLEMWQLTALSLEQTEDEQQFTGLILKQLKEPGKFLSKMKELSIHPEQSSLDELYFKDGRIFERYSHPHRLGQQIVGRVWSFKDITHQKKAEWALKERESLFSNLFDCSPIGVVMGTHIGGTLSYANTKFCEMLGYTATELTNLTVNDITHPDDRGIQRELYQRLLANELDAFSVEKRYVRKDGSTFWAHVTISLAKDANGQVEYDIVIVQDISEKRQTEAALKDSEAKFRNIFEHSPFSSLLLQKRKMISCNEETLRLLGYDHKKELLSSKIVDLSPEFQPNGVNSDGLSKMYGDQAVANGFADFEWMLKRKNGDEVLTRAILTPLTLNGEEALFVIFIDLTKQKANEAQIEKLFKALQAKNQELEEKVTERTLKLQKSNQELKRSNQDLEQFAYIASHDLQEPLRMVGNFVQLLDRQYKDSIDEDGRVYIRFAVDGVTRMSKLIQNLLSYSRVGRSDVTFEPSNLNEVIDKKVIDLSHRIMQQKAQVELVELPVDLACEPSQVGIVFYNLIGNAIKFNQSEKPKVRVTKEEKENEWLFAIQDNGIGIDSRYKDRVFQIFKRLHRREEYEGTGIGLSLCKRIINRHKGRIWFHSELGEGTTFYFTISKRLS